VNISLLVDDDQSAELTLKRKGIPQAFQMAPQTGGYTPPLSGEWPQKWRGTAMQQLSFRKGPTSDALVQAPNTSTNISQNL